MKRLSIVALIFIIIDQIVKIIISNTMKEHQSIVIIKNFFNITYTQNDGAAWSIMSGNRIILILISVFVLGLVYFLFIKDKKITKTESVIYGLLIGGIVGNLIDRIISGKVIDYLDFNILGYNYPIFNIADICIVVSIIILIILTLKGEKHANK